MSAHATEVHPLRACTQRTAPDVRAASCTCRCEKKTTSSLVAASSKLCVQWLASRMMCCTSGAPPAAHTWRALSGTVCKRRKSVLMAASASCSLVSGGMAAAGGRCRQLCSFRSPKSSSPNVLCRTDLRQGHCTGDRRKGRGRARSVDKHTDLRPGALPTGRRRSGGRRCWWIHPPAARPAAVARTALPALQP